MKAYEVKLDAVPAATGALTTAEITGILAGLDPTALQDAGAAQTRLGRELAAMATHLSQEAGTLAQNWSGTAARTALTQFQRLHQQTVTLATQASQTGDVLTWLGTQVLPAFQHPATPAQARDHLTNLTAALIQADTALPATIGTPTPTRTATGPSIISPGVTTSPGNPTSRVNRTSSFSHSSPVTLTGTTSHSAQGSPIGTPLAPGPMHPASPVSSLQSAAPVPNANPSAATTATPAPALAPPPGPAPAPVPSPIPLANVPATSGTTVTTTTSDVTSDATPEVAPAPATPVTANKSGAANPHDPSDDHQAQPAPAVTTSSPHAAPTSALPSLPGTPIAAPAPAPEVSPTSPALSARPLPKLPTLDGAALNSDLSGGAFPLPPQSATPTAINPVGAATAPANHSFLPPAPGVTTPPSQERHRDSWAAEDRNPWGLPANCVPPLIEGS